jgi:hypothetical protein
MNTNGQDTHLLQVLQSSFASTLQRVAVVANQGVRSFMLQELRTLIPTYVVSSFSEMRAAMASESSLFGLDIREMSVADAALLSRCLAESRKAQAAVYIMTPEQQAEFDATIFQYTFQ